MPENDARPFAVFFAGDVRVWKTPSFPLPATVPQGSAWARRRGPDRDPHPSGAPPERREAGKNAGRDRFFTDLRRRVIEAVAIAAPALL